MPYTLRTAVLLIGTAMMTMACSGQQEAPAFKTKEGYITVRDAEIYYKRVGVGAGDPIMVIHGGPLFDHGYLAPYMEPLARDHELIYYDQRLSGRSSGHTDSAEVRIDRFVDDIEALRKAMGLEKVHLLAHSWGGLLAMNYAIGYPENLRSLILMNSLPGSAELWNKEQQERAARVSPETRVARQEILNSDLFRDNPSQAVKQLLALSFRDEFNDPGMADSLEFYIPEDYMSRSKALGYLAPELSTYDLHSELQGLDIPTLLIYGAKEPAASGSGVRLDSTMGHALLRVIPNTGHFPFVERRERVMEEILSFLNKKRSP